MINRPAYLEKLHKWRDTDLVKIVTGIRRCGKSTLFELYQNELKQSGTAREQIISINLEDADNYELLEWKALHTHIESLLIPNKKNYVFLDEIQQVDGAQRLLSSLRLKPNIDLYVTGSNAWLLSSELATLITGRYIEINMLPLSFAEYMSAFQNEADTGRKYADYISNSSLPRTLTLKDRRDIQDYIMGIYSTIVQKDIAFHHGIRDISRLDSVARFMFDNIGSETSIRNISNAMTSGGRKIHQQTVESYLNGLLGSYVLYKANRYDIKGKQHLLTNAKYYLADIGLRFALLGNTPGDAGHILENVVYLELLRRGYKVFIGKVETREVDFVVQNTGGETEYYQVALTVLEAKTLNHELEPLRKIKDNYPKYLLTRDWETGSRDGIRQLNVLDWLLGKGGH
ncbi:MAG: ATP-binding protein [Treponema sp.]|jgi:predicted AAA+ superfamily ATPase|nr:ATP-binding protein [Treponema sp.]